jgi:hypothetical protein
MLGLCLHSSQGKELRVNVWPYCTYLKAVPLGYVGLGPKEGQEARLQSLAKQHGSTIYNILQYTIDTVQHIYNTESSP